MGQLVTSLSKFLFCLPILAGVLALAQETPRHPSVMYEVKHDISAPVDSLLHSQMGMPAPSQRLAEDPNEVLFASGSRAAGPDSVVQRQAGSKFQASVILNFDGLASNGYAVPDGNGSVGATQFVETTNGQYAVYNKTNGALVFGPVPLSTIWTSFGGLCESGGTQFDPIVLYDKAAGRWFISQLIENSTNTAFMECIAVSTTADPTGSYARYGFSFGSTLNDYPKFGIWPDAYYASYNMYRNGTQFIGAKACAYNRTAMLAGHAASAVCFQRTAADWNLLPADQDGNTPPPAGSPNYYVELPTPLPSTALKLYQFHVDFSHAANSTFTGPTSIPIASWTRLCGTTIACIPQPSPGQKVDGMGYRLLNRLAYRNFGDHETLLATHNVDSAGGIAGIRWYEIRSPHSAPIVFQQGTYSRPTSYIWMGTLATDKNGDIGMGMNSSSMTMKPSVLITGRVPSDPLNTLESLLTVLTGAGVQTNDANRWGDYSSISVDPVDDCTFWYTSQYYKTTGSNWNTRIVSFKFDGCN